VLGSGSERWLPCDTINIVLYPTHPCAAESVLEFRVGSYFYSFADVTDQDFDLPLNPDLLSASDNETVNMHALLCMLELDRTDPVKIVQGCTTNVGLQDNRFYMISLMARGEADCNSSVNCGAEALVTERIGGFGPGGGEGGPGVPLTARTNIPLKGTVEIVPNPNGGGLGVPISSWVNANTTCDVPAPDPPISPDSGSYATCERHEWYGVAEWPDDLKCSTAKCDCSKTDDKLLSYADGADRILGIDIVIDPEFPCDLWTYMFGYDKSDYLKVKEQVPSLHLLSDCSTLDENSVGFYWVSGPSCDLKDQVGSKFGAVFLMSAAADTRVSAGAELFGVLMVTDVEEPGAQFTGNGHATIFGAALMDAVMEHFNGTFQIVYVDNLLNQALETGGSGVVAGGWTDFHDSWQ
jgi:hypothetical protein